MKTTTRGPSGLITRSIRGSFWTVKKPLCSSWNANYGNYLVRNESAALKGFKEPVWDREMLTYRFENGKGPEGSETSKRSCILSIERPVSQDYEYVFVDD